MDAGRPSKRAVAEISDDAGDLEQCSSFLDREQCMDANTGNTRTDTMEPRIKPKTNHQQIPAHLHPEFLLNLFLKPCFSSGLILSPLDHAPVTSVAYSVSLPPVSSLYLLPQRFFLVTLLRYNSHTVQFTFFKRYNSIAFSIS